MTTTEVLVLLLIAALCGGLGKSLVGDASGGFLGSMVIGIVGAIIGVWLVREFGLPILLGISIGERSFPLIWSVIGAAVLTVGWGFIYQYLRRP